MYKIIEAFLNKESNHINLLLLPESIQKGTLRASQWTWPSCSIIASQISQISRGPLSLCVCLSTRNPITSYAMRQNGRGLGVSGWALGFRASQELHCTLTCIFLFVYFSFPASRWKWKFINESCCWWRWQWRWSVYAFCWWISVD